MTDTVRSAARVLELVEFLAAADGGVSLSEATGGLAAPKSSTLMLLRTLVNLGYAYRDNDSDRYFLSTDYRAGAFGWVSDPLARLSAIARPLMEELSHRLGETVTMGVWGQGAQARMLIKIVADVDVRYDTDITRPIPIYCTAIGRALLSGRTREERVALIGDAPLKAVTPHTLTNKTKLLAMLDEVKRDGFAIAMEEFALGGTGVAAPVQDNHGAVIAALNVGCVTHRFHDKRDQVISAVKQGAAAISKRLEGRDRP